MKISILAFIFLSLFTRLSFAGALEDAGVAYDDVLEAQTLASGYWGDVDDANGEIAKIVEAISEITLVKSCALIALSKAARALTQVRELHKEADKLLKQVGVNKNTAWENYDKAFQAHQAGNEREAQKWADQIPNQARAIENLAEQLRKIAEKAGLALDRAELALEEARGCQG